MSYRDADPPKTQTEASADLRAKARYVTAWAIGIIAGCMVPASITLLMSGMRACYTMPASPSQCVDSVRIVDTEYREYSCSAGARLRTVPHGSDVEAHCECSPSHADAGNP